MRIALVQMPPHPRDTPPFEAALTAAILRRGGHEVRVFDVNNALYKQTYKQRPLWKFQLTDHSVDPSEALVQSEGGKFEEWREAILAARPDAVVFKTENAYQNAVHMARLIREKAPALFVVASGANTADEERVRKWKEEQDGADQYGRPNLPFHYFIVGEDDLALPLVLEALAAGTAAELPARLPMTGRVVDARGGPRVQDMDSLPFYDFTNFDLMQYGDPTTLRFSISRGCTQHCSFCQDWVVGKRFRCMSGRRWFDEYRHQHETHPEVVHFRHYDRLLNGDIAALETFCDLVLSRYDEPPVAWGGDFIVRPEMTDALIAKMARARCNSFGTGLESGSEKVRADMFKDFFSNELAARTFESCRRHNIPVSMNILIGYPTETDADLEESIRFVEQNRRNLHEVRLTAPTLLVQPGTPLANSPKRFGLDGADHEKWRGADGRNDYAERVGRFRRFCERMIELGDVRVAINRRIVKTPESLDQLVKECLEGVPALRTESGTRQLRRKIDRLGSWLHCFDFGGVKTKAGCYPLPVWERLAPDFPKDLTGLTVLDAGCGDGWYALKAKSLGARSVLGIETNHECIARAEFARETLGVQGVSFRYGNIFGLKRDARYDIGLLIDVFQDFDDPVGGLRKVAEEAAAVYLTAYLDLRDERPAMSWAPEHPDYGFMLQFCNPLWLPTSGFLKQALGPLGFAAEELSRRMVTKDLAHVVLRAALIQPGDQWRERWALEETAAREARQRAAREARERGVAR